MDRSLTLVAGCALALALADPCTGQDGPAFLRRVPADFENVLHIGDALPELERALRSEPLARALREGRLGELLDAAEIAPIARDPRALANALHAFEGWIPTELTVAVPGELLASFGETCRAAIAAALAIGARMSAPPDDAAHREHADTLLRAVGAVSPPRLTAHAVFRSDAMADRVFEWLVEVLDRVSLAGLVHEAGVSELRLVLDPRTLASNSAAWPRFASTALGGGDTPDARRLLDALAALRTEVVVRVDGARLELDVGAVDRTATLLRTSLGELFTGGAGELLFVRWDQSALQEISSTAHDAFVDALDSPAYEAFAEAFPGRLEQLVDAIGQNLYRRARGAASLRVGDELVWITSTPLSDDESADDYDTIDEDLEAWLPEGVAAAWVDGDTTLDWVAWSTLTQIGDQVLERMHRAMVRGDDAAHDRLATVYEFLWDTLGDLDDYLGGDESAVFRAGVAMVADLGEPLRSVRVADDTEPLEFDGLRLPALLVVARPALPGAGQAFVTRAWREVLSGLGDPAPAARVPAAAGLSLRPPVPAVVPPLAGTILTDDDARISIDGELGIHYFEHAGFLVVSTSAALTQRALDAFESRRGAAFAAQEPRRVEAPARLSSMHSSGAGLATLLRATARTLHAMQEGAGRALLAAVGMAGLEPPADASRVVEAFAELAALLGAMRSDRTLADGVIVEHTVISFRD